MRAVAGRHLLRHPRQDLRGRIYTSKQDLLRQRSWAVTVIDTFSVATWLMVLAICVPQIIFINRALKAGN